MSKSPIVRFRPVQGLSGSTDDRKALRVMAAEVALNKMFNERTFSICAVNDACSALEVELTPEARAILQPLHCVEWDKIPHELKQEIPHLIKESIRRSAVIRSMVTDMILGDFSQKSQEFEAVVEEETKSSSKEQSKQYFKWW